MLRKIRITLAAVMFIGITLLFLDFTGTMHQWVSWMPKIQFLEAVLALNVVVIAALILLTLIFGRMYCSVICPLGVMQDIIAWFGKKARKNRYSYSKAKHSAGGRRRRCLPAAGPLLRLRAHSHQSAAAFIYRWQ